MQGRTVAAVRATRPEGAHIMNMTSATPEVLAGLLALRPLRDYPAGACVAWMESAERLCGKPATDWLCPRHEGVARKRFAREVEKIRAELAARAARSQALRPEREAKLAKIEARLSRIDPFRTDTGPADRAAACAPLRQRMPSDARVSELAKLHREREHLRRVLAAYPPPESRECDECGASAGVPCEWSCTARPDGAL